MSSCGGGVHAGDRCGQLHQCVSHISVLGSAFFAACEFPPFDLSKAFTHKDEHLVWVSRPGVPLQIIA